MKAWVTVFLTVLLCIVVLPGVSAQTEGDVTVINGTVTNRTPGGGLPVDAPVTLQFFADSAWTSIYTSTIKNDGTYIFTDLESELGHDFVTRMVYGDVEYFSEPALLEGSVDVEILIFEPTDDATFVQIDQAHYFIVPVPDSNTLQISEYYLIGNGGDKTYAGVMDSNTGMRTTVHFTPPAGAVGLSFDGPGLGERYVGDVGQFADTRAVLPGNATIDVSYSYELALEPNLVIEHAMDIPVSSVVIIVSGGEMGLEGTDLQFTGIMDTQMGPAASYTAGPLTSAETLSFMMIPLSPNQVDQPASGPQAVSVKRQRDNGQETGIGVIVLVAAAIGAYQLWQTPARFPVPEEARVLVQQIAELDQKLEQDELDRPTYQAQRRTLMRQVRQFVRP